MTPLIIGEAPNRLGRGRLANTTRSGKVLEALGARDLPRTNVLQQYPGPSGKGARFPVKEAGLRMLALDRRYPKRVPWLVLGKRVAAAMGLRAGYLEWTEWRGRRVAVVPHPSGVNRWWNSEENRTRAGEFFRALLEEA